jgi:hypothetical protein
MQLHKFAASVSNTIYRNKVYMVTKPVGKMVSIMINTLNIDGGALYIGDAKERDDSLPLSPLNNLNDFNWTITTPDGDVISFPKPDWFAHCDLSPETARTFIICIEELMKLPRQMPCANCF